MDILVLVALWCGNPIYASIYDYEAKRTVKAVQECRERILKCIDDPPRTSQNIKAVECAKKEKL